MCAPNPGIDCRTARQREITSPTGALPHKPRSNGNALSPRPVIPATMPNRSRQPGTSQSGSAWSRRRSSTVMTDDVGTECPQAFVDALVATLDLANVVDRTGAVRCQCSQQHRHSGADVRRLDPATAQARGPADHGAVRI